MQKKLRVSYISHQQCTFYIYKKTFYPPPTPSLPAVRKPQKWKVATKIRPRLLVVDNVSVSACMEGWRAGILVSGLVFWVEWVGTVSSLTLLT